MESPLTFLRSAVTAKVLRQSATTDLAVISPHRHLLDLGHRRIRIIAGPDYASSSRGRLTGYRRGDDRSGSNHRSRLDHRDPLFGIDSGAEAAERMMKLTQTPTAIFAENDNTAIGALSTLAKLGLSVPDDISLVGCYNDIPLVSSAPHLRSRQFVFHSTRLRLPGAGPASREWRCFGLLIRSASLRPALIPRKSTSSPITAQAI